MNSTSARKTPALDHDHTMCQVVRRGMVILALAILLQACAPIA